jgi:hypothetical protein
MISQMLDGSLVIAYEILVLDLQWLLFIPIMLWLVMKVVNEERRDGAYEFIELHQNPKTLKPKCYEPGWNCFAIIFENLSSHPMFLFKPPKIQIYPLTNIKLR